MIADETRVRRKSRAARVAKIGIRATNVNFRDPARAGGKLRDVRLNVVEAVELDPPAGEEPIRWVLYTSLPINEIAQIQRVIALYALRWTIEGMFGELTLSLNGEINTLAYPPAAIIAYALALISYNVLTLVRASVEVVHGQETADSMSAYQMAEELKRRTRAVQIRRYRKANRGPKKPKPKRTGSRQHVSTHKLLSQ